MRLTALSEAGNQGSWAAAGELRLRGPGTPASGGSWARRSASPLVPAAAAVLPGNKVLVWSAYAVDTYGGGVAGQTQTAILDVATGRVGQRLITSTSHDMFCPGVSILADGRILVTGGDTETKASIYNPATDTWTAASPMNIGRGYQTTTTLASGRVVTLGGSWSDEYGGKVAEVYDPATNTWTKYPGITTDGSVTVDHQDASTAAPYRGDNHMWLYQFSRGRVVQAGPSKQMWQLDLTGTGSKTSLGLRGTSGDSMNASAVYYDIDKLLVLGGSQDYSAVAAAKQEAFALDFTGNAPVTTRVGDMSFARSYQNSVAMPDGTVEVFGGQPMPVTFSDTGAVNTPEPWDPRTGRFTQLTPGPTPRVYHSSAMLLPDARVISLGGGLCGTGCSTNHPDAQIFTPPYLLNADGTAPSRPVITAAPSTATAGSTISVTTDRAVSSFAMVRYGQATHGVDTDQRRVPLTIASTSGGTRALRLPADRGVLVPGPYMLFALDANGTPSVSKTIVIG